MSEEIVFDLINCSGEECKEFSNKVENEDIDFSEIEEMFNFYRSKTNYKEDEVIKLIKNISLTQYHVSMEKTDYQVQCGRTLLTVAKYIEGEGSLNFKILKALCLSQFSKDEKSFIPDADFIVLGMIRGRFDSMPSFDVDASEHIKSVFDNIVKDDPRYFCIDY